MLQPIKVVFTNRCNADGEIEDKSDSYELWCERVHFFRECVDLITGNSIKHAEYSSITSAFSIEGQRWADMSICALN